MILEERTTTKPMILFLAEELRTGGAETYFYTLEKRINRDHFSFHSMAVPSGNEDLLAFPEYFTPYAFSSRSRIKAIVDFAKESSPSIVHANSLRLCFCAAVAKKIGNYDFKIVYTKHNITALEKISKALFAKFVNDNVDSLIAICGTDRVALSAAGVNENLIHQINNGVDLERYDFCQREWWRAGESKKLHIGILARLSPEKRHDLFIDIADIVHQKYPKVSFSIAGDGAEFKSIAAKIKSKHLEKTVEMLGRVNPQEYLKTVDVLLLVSDREVMPMSLLEGMASGCVVVSRAVGGVKDIVSSDTGFLVTSERPADYLRVLDCIFDSQSINEIAFSARELVEQDYALDSSIKSHSDLYMTLLG